MRILFSIATSLLFAIAPCAVASAQAIAQWNETTHDFGLFHESAGKQTCKFVITNMGDSALIITRVQTTCGCTVAKYTTDPIMPGEKGNIEVTYSPTGRPGPFDKSVWVYTNTSPNKTRLMIEGSVIGSPENVKKHYPVDAGDLQFTTTTLPLGETKKGSLPACSTTAYNTSSDTIALSFDNNTSHISCGAIPDTIPPVGISTMSFFFDSNKTPVWGINDDYVTVIATPLHSEKPPRKIKINIVANVVEDFSKLTSEEFADAPVCHVDVSKMLVPDTERGKVSSGMVTVENTGKSNLVIRRVMSTHKAIVAKVDKTLVKPGSKANIEVFIYTKNVEGDIINTQFTIISNDPVNPRITIPIAGRIIP